MASSLSVTRAGSKRRNSSEYLCTVVQEQGELIKRQKAEIAALKKKVSAQELKISAQMLDLSEKNLLATAMAPSATAAPPMETRLSLLPGVALVVTKFEVHDFAPMFPKEPAVPCINAGRAIKVELELHNRVGERTTPPPGLTVHAALHVECSPTPLKMEDISWMKRGSSYAVRDATTVEPLRLSIGRNNTFMMERGMVAFSARINVYSSEVWKRRFYIVFTASNPEVKFAATTSVNSMSRTPNSRKQVQQRKSLGGPLLLAPPMNVAAQASALAPAVAPPEEPAINVTATLADPGSPTPSPAVSSHTPPAGDVHTPAALGQSAEKMFVPIAALEECDSSDTADEATTTADPTADPTADAATAAVAAAGDFEVLDVSTNLDALLDNWP